jgi:very-short-patch-repair endonuclease
MPFKCALTMKGSMPNAIKKQKKAVLMMVAMQARNLLVKMARTELHSSAANYIAGIGYPVSKSGNVELSLKGSIPNMIEEGSGPFDMKCLVSPYAKIFTSKGYKFIKDIKVEELVLTHEGKMKRVLKTWKVKNDDEFVYRIKAFRGNWVTITENHPILTTNGWKQAKDLDENLDRVLVRATTCGYCGKLFEYGMNEHNTYCSKSCAAKSNNQLYRQKGRPDLLQSSRISISEKASERNSRLLKLGVHPWQKKRNELIDNGLWGWQNEEQCSKAQKLAATAIGKKHTNSDPESKLYMELDKGGLSNIFDRQVLFKRNSFKNHKSGKQIQRWWFLDFANEKLKVAIEVNGEHWHTQNGVEDRKKELGERGWTCLNFWSKEIYNNPKECIDEIKRILRNHNNEYKFIPTNFKIKKIRRNKFSYFSKYNLTVADDSSFVADSLVVHNSGFLRSRKAKKGKKGKYITIPLSLKSSGAMGGSPPVMPGPIYNMAKGLGFGQRLQLSKTYEGYGIRSKLSNDLKKWGNYTWKTSPFQGIVKYQRYPGLVPLGLPREKLASYKVFRRVSKNSDPGSWIHPGFKPRNFMSKVMTLMYQEFPKLLDAIM